MLKPRFALNVYTIGGVVFVIVGAGLLIGAGMLPFERTLFVSMGGGFLAAGLLWVVLAGRRGRLRDPRGLAQSGTQCRARLAGVKATSSTTRSGEYGPIISQVFRLDLEIAGPNGPYSARIFRSLRGGQIVRAIPGQEVPVAVDPSRPRRIAILWDRLPVDPGQALLASLAGGAAGFGRVAALSSTQQAPTPARVTSVATAGVANDGSPVLQLVVELAATGGPARFAQGVVSGPRGHLVSVGDLLQVRLDPTGSAIIAVDW